MEKIHHAHGHQPDRRNFLTKAAAIVVGGVITVVPALAGLFVLFDPLRRGATGSRTVRVTSLNTLKENGPPQAFEITATQVDAWNRTPNVAVGSVYLQRLPGDKVRALNKVCPHAGCPVSYRPGQKHFFCPCHNSSFADDGRILDPKSPSPRAMDELDVEIRDGDVWVKFQNFKKGVHEKISV
jgi:Rieske Fe-S protein